MGTIDVTVRLQALDGTWETCGADRAIKVIPESETHVHDEWGPKTAGFTLKRSVIALWPDLGAFTPVEIEIGGTEVWDGQIADTPTKGAWEINVQCEGWQAHLDDDVYQRNYVHSKLTDWKDSRSFLGADLTRYVAAPTVGSQQGAITLGWANGSPVATNNAVGVTLDLGAGTARRVVIELDKGTVTDTPIKLYVRGSNNDNAISTPPVTDAIENIQVSTGGGHYSGSFSEPVRYVTIFLIYTGGGGTYANDQIARIKQALVFGDTTYESGNASIITGDVIGKDALERATLLLSSDFSQIAKPSFVIPDFVLAKATTPRETWEAINAYYNYITKLLPGRRFSFQPRPTAPQLEIGAWSQTDPEDPSANSGAEIYNRALVEATGPDGSPLVVARSALQQPGVSPRPVVSPLLENPSFAANAEHWTASGGGTITRDTSTFHSSPASGKWKPSAAGQTLTALFTGTFVKGETYTLTFWSKAEGGEPILPTTFGSTGPSLDSVTSDFAVRTAWREEFINWTPTRNEAAAAVVFTSSGTVPISIDDFALTAAEPTLVDRRGFRRTKTIQMSSAITVAEGNQIGDIYLQSHMSTPFKGSASLSPGAVRRVLGGAPTHPSQLGLYTQQLLRLSDHIDPDTGGLGRDGTIAEVSYEHKSQKAAVTLDDKRGNFEALLSRLAVVQTPGS